MTADRPAVEVCGIPWPVCPDDLGAGLSTSAGVSRCRRCGRSWPEGERNPCPDPATVLLAAADPKAEPRTLFVCESHARHPSAQDLRKLHDPDA